MIFSHVLYQLSYPGVTARAPYGEAAPPWQAAVSIGLSASRHVCVNRRAGQGIAIAKPPQQIAVAARGRTKWCGGAGGGPLANGATLGGHALAIWA